MRYNPHTPIAVFVGPSLPRTEAVQLLDANYYPPARMGDIYRLLGSGVRIIILIDGIFHSHAAVWQRELLEALEQDIVIMGAASMGALRAAELHTLGMIGYGTIFEWYRDGIIEGDDEVALQHADEANGFLPFSEPLVNLRYTFLQAAAQKLISPAQAGALIEYAKRTYYAERSYTSLLTSPIVKSWSSQTQSTLRQFVHQQSVNLKKQDAIGVLNECSLRWNRITQSEKRPIPAAPLPSSQGGYYGSVRYQNRGFFHTAGYLIRGEALLVEAMKDDKLVRALRPVLSKNYFLTLWAKQKGIICPPDYVAAYLQTWQNNLPKDHSQWLRANGLTNREFETVLVERALLAWLIESATIFFGETLLSYLQFLETSLSRYPIYASEGKALAQEKIKNDRTAELIKQAGEICYLVDWAKQNGVICPASTIEKFIKAWETNYRMDQRAIWLKAMNLAETPYLALLAEWACADWLTEKGPAYFGYTSWVFEVALLKELQITGKAAQIVEEISSFPVT